MNEFRKWLDDERGRGVELARTLGVTPGAVTQWADGQVPAERMFKISELTGISLRDLRPDLLDDVA